jgi:hypothetical protein
MSIREAGSSETSAPIVVKPVCGGIPLRNAWICGSLAAHLIGAPCLSIHGGWSFDETAAGFVQCDHHLSAARFVALQRRLS